MNAREELNASVVNIELTLTSIIQGVALYFLTDNARARMSWHDWSAGLYVAAGLCIIFIFWSRSIIHTLTLIKWPLQFGHNFFYIACALGEAVLFTRLGRPLGWFMLSTAYAAMVWLLFAYDMRLIRARLSEARDENERILFSRTRRDQWLNITALLPLMFLFNLACVWGIRRWPAFFLDRGGDVLLVSAQLLSFVIYLIYVTTFFNRIAPGILDSRRSEEKSH